MAKKKKTKKPSTIDRPVAYNEPKSVNVKKAGNGFVVSSYTNTGEKVLVAKTRKEANDLANKMLGG